MAKAKGRAYYVIRLGDPHQQVKLVTGFPRFVGIYQWKHPAVLFRYGQRLKGFMLSNAQLAKLRRGTGTIQISSKQVEDFSYLADSAGR